MSVPVPYSPSHGDGETRRISPRFESNHNAACGYRNIFYPVEIRDVSETGACILIRSGVLPEVGQSLELRFMNGITAACTVVWNTGAHVGVVFDEPLPHYSDALHFDELGADYFRAVLRLQIAQKNGLLMDRRGS
ncbi:MAG: PilZ domain-containing protein [Hyphomicrobiaceae bacterium]